MIFEFVLLLIINSIILKRQANAEILLNDNVNCSKYEFYFQDSVINTEQVTVFSSPAEIYPTSFKIATYFQGKDAGGFAKAIIKYDLANWSVIIWYLKTVHHNKHKSKFCVDIGGNHGTFSLLMAALGCSVQIFEIQPNLVALESYATKINNFEDKIQVFHTGLSDVRTSMKINGNAGYAFLTSDENSNSVAVPVLLGDDCIEKNPLKHYTVIKIDVEGFEIRTLNGLSNVINSSHVESLHIEIGPNRWERANLNFTEGFRILKKVLQNKYHVHLLARDSDSCPYSVFPSSNSSDLKLLGSATLKYITWQSFENVLQIMYKNDYDCNFWFVQNSMENLTNKYGGIFSNLISSLENKCIKGAGREVYFIKNSMKHLIWDWDSFLSLKYKQEDIVVLSNEIIENLFPSGPNIQV
jgi:FkbM family methyltransferase